MRDAEFSDPRLVEVYDAECPWAVDDDFFVALVNEARNSRVIDLGCGTGRLAVALAAAGHQVTGVEPALASLAAARRKHGSNKVTWIQGTSSSAPVAAFDVAVMTSHVAQVFLGDEEWDGVLSDLHRALVPGGRLAFDSRDPQARAWERWVPQHSRRNVDLGSGRTVIVWTDVTGISGERVTFTRHFQFPDGEELRSESTLRFRSETCLRATLTAAGFTVEHIYGGWQREPAGSGNGELIVVARA